MDLQKNLNEMSVEELEAVIARSQERIKEKQQAEQEAQRYRMISCPSCRKLVPSDSRFCAHCGGSMQVSPKQPEPKREPAWTPQPEPKREPVWTQPEREPVRTEPKREASWTPQPERREVGSCRVSESVKKWEMLAGEGDISDWREAYISAPEKKPFAYMKVTTKRILISTEGRMQHGLRNGSGLIVYALTAGMEKGKPWLWIPLECVRSYRLTGKKEMEIQADQTYHLISSKAKDIYAALQQVIPNKAL